MVKRGEVWLVQWGSSAGDAEKVSLPGLIVSPMETNEHCRTVMVAPMTTTSLPAPFRVPLRFMGKKGLVLLEQSRAVEKSQLVRRLGSVQAAALSTALATLQEFFSE